DIVLNNSATILNVSAQDLMTLVEKVPAPQLQASDDGESPEPQRVQEVTLDPTKGWLALLALRSPAARAWLQAQACERVLDDGQPDSVLLVKILDADFRMEEPASVNTWLATLDPAEEAALSSVLERDVPLEAKVV